MTSAPGAHVAHDIPQSDEIIDLTQELELIDLDGPKDLHPVLDLTGVDDEEGLDGKDWIREVTPDTEHAVGADLAPGNSLLNSVHVFDTCLTPGMDVELSDRCFLRIKRIVTRRNTGQTLLEGIYMIRISSKKVLGQLPKLMNELCVMQTVDTHKRRDELRSVPVSEIVAIRKIIFTNTQYPTHSIYMPGYAGTRYRTQTDRREMGVLVCRWKWTTYIEPGSAKDKAKVTEECMAQLREDECDIDKAMPDVRLLAIWLDEDDEPRSGRNRDQGSTVPEPICLSDDDADDDFEVIGPPPTPSAFPGPSIQLLDRRFSSLSSSSNTITSFFRVTKRQKTVQSPRRQTATHHAQSKYSFGDICAGAGGMSRGAAKAGLKIKFLLDKWGDACRTLRANWDASLVIEKDIFDFITKLPNSARYRVDVLHISFPCQPHSPAHTVAGKDDDQNVAAGYSVIELLKKCKPRVVTFEQTSGILTHRGRVHFNALMHQITFMGYSVRYKIANCAEYGNVHARKRAFIFAAAPGQKLPDFPDATHGVGLKSFVTIGERLRQIRHIRRALTPYMAAYTDKSAEAYGDNTPLTKAITCSGGFGDIHPHGGRTFNMQELALMADFPWYHKFAPAGKTSLRKQIGNAVPTGTSYAMYGAVINALRRTDEQIKAWRPQPITLD